MRRIIFSTLVALGWMFTSQAEAGQTVVALGASFTFGYHLAPAAAYPAQLESILRAQGRDVRVINAGTNGETTDGMRGRIDAVLLDKPQVVIFQPGTNDASKVPGGAINCENVEAVVVKTLEAGSKLMLMAGKACRAKLAKYKIRYFNFTHHAQDGDLQNDQMHLTETGAKHLAEILAPTVSIMLDNSKNNEALAGTEK